MFVKTSVDVIHNRSKRTRKKDEVCMAYPVGEKILINHLDFQIGGGGTNTAVAFSRLGLSTAYLGKIGKDENGAKVFKLLQDEKVKFIGPVGKMTGFSVILDSIKDDRTILTHKGCNDNLKYSEIHESLLETKWFYFSSMVGESLQTIKEIAKYAQKENIKVAFNPSSYQAKKGIENIEEILDACNILILNKDEAFYLTKKKNINLMLKELKKYAKEYVIVTDGANGVWCYDGKKRIRGVSKKNLVILETTGAGDAFASGVVSGLIKGKEIKTALRMGFIESESVIQAYGAKNDLLSWRKMLKMLKSDRRKFEITNL